MNCKRKYRGRCGRDCVEAVWGIGFRLSALRSDLSEIFTLFFTAFFPFLRYDLRRSKAVKKNIGTKAYV